jgi:exopolysaccharide biosynthesis polyprenyl glycosylphosphotransferase
MLRERTHALQAAIAVMDAAATVAAFFGTYYAVGFLPERWLGLKTVLPISQYLWVLIISVPLWWVLFGFFGCYDLSPIERARDTLLRMAAPMAVGALAVGAAAFFSKEPLFSRRVVGAFLVGNVALLIAGRVAALKMTTRLYRVTGALRRVLVVGVGEAAREFGEAVRRAGWGLEFAGHVAPSPEERTPDCLGVISELPRILDERAVDDVVIADAGGDLAAVQRAIQACEEVGVSIHIPSRFFAAALSRPHLEAFSGIRMLTFTTAPYNPVALGVKRAADLLGSILLLILFSVPMLIFAAVIKLTSPGPVLFKQRRSGLYGRGFTLHKFRSMVADAEQRQAELTAANEMGGPVFKMRNDPRVTPFGRFLRRYSLDELPQLWNVLKGDMSLIGPRPPLPAEVAKYERWQRRRLSMRPGLTCIWQVTDRNRATFEKWMEYDLNYIDHWTLWLDFKIALQTIPAVLKGTGV